MAIEPSTLEEDGQLFLNESMTESSFFQVGLGEAAVYSRRAPGKEGSNEDAALLMPCGALSCVMAVADGVGGSRDAAQAARSALRKLRKEVQDALARGESLRTGILNGFEAANKAVLAIGTGAATTLTVAEVDNHFLRTYHVGDSFVMLVGQRGKLKLQTVSHSPTGYGMEAGLLNEKDAMFHDERHVVSNVVGAADMRIEIGSKIEISPRDTVLLASDGLSDNLQTGEILETIRKGALETAAAGIAARATARMLNESNGKPSKPDDLTFILFRIDEAGAKKR